MPRAPRYHGWTIAWALAVTQTVGYGVLFYAFSVFLRPMEQELGWTRAQSSGAFSLALLLSGLAAIPVGRWVDAHGARALTTAASSVAALLVFAWSFVQTLPALYLVQAGIGVVMAAVLYEVAFTVLASWFRRDRIKAMLVVTMVAGLASTIFVPLATWLEAALGWREALRALAVLLALLTVPLHGLVLRRDPGQLGWGPDGVAADDNEAAAEPSLPARRAFRTGSFWWLTGAFGLDRIAIVGVAAHAVPMLLERGHGPALVAAAAGSIGLMQVAGRLLFAPATQRVPLSRLASATYLVRALALVGLLLIPGVTGLWWFAGLFGIANGASTLARAGLVAETFGPAHYGSINGAMTSAVAVAQMVAPLAVGAIHVHAGGYESALWALAALALAAALAVGHGNRAAEPAWGRP